MDSTQDFIPQEFISNHVKTLTESIYDASQLTRSGRKGGDVLANVRFFIETLESSGLSLESGEIVFRDVEMIEITFPGSKDVITREVTEDDKKRFPLDYKLWKDGTSGKIPGFPVREWPRITATKLKALERLNIYTLEQIINAPEHLLVAMGPDSRELKRQAESWLEASKEAVKVAAYTETIDAQKKEIDRLSQLVKDLAGDLEKVKKK